MLWGKTRLFREPGNSRSQQFIALNVVPESAGVCRSHVVPTLKLSTYTCLCVYESVCTRTPLLCVEVRGFFLYIFSPTPPRGLRMVSTVHVYSRRELIRETDVCVRVEILHNSLASACGVDSSGGHSNHSPFNMQYS